MNPFKKYITALLLIVTVMILADFTGCSSGNESKEILKTGTPGLSEPAVELKTSMRKLWEDHVTWTRNVIFCLADGLPGTQQAVTRLLQNQVDIGNTIKPYYGTDAGNKLTELLKAHITISADVVTGAKTGNKSLLDEAGKKWYANADEICVFLGNANPNWSLADLKMMMQDHLKLTTDEAVQRIKKNYDADIIAYDNVHNEILKMSDMLTDGIVRQFPEKFSPAIQ